MGLYRSKNITAAKRTADRWFNRYIRLSQADPDGNASCITCEAEYHLSENKLDAGHFVESDRLATRYDERNVNTQCKSCNLSANGKQYQHGLAIDELHGAGTAAELIEEGEVKESYSKEELMALAREYKDKCEELESKIKLENDE